MQVFECLSSMVRHPSSKAWSAWVGNCPGTECNVKALAALHEPRPIALDDNAPQNAALAAIIVAMRAMHRGAVIDHQHVAPAPGVMIDDPWLDDALQQVLQVFFARFRCHALDALRFGDVEIDRARAMHR